MSEALGPSDHPREQLQRLLDRLAAHRSAQAGNAQHFAVVRSAVERHLRTVGLVHGISKDLRSGSSRDILVKVLEASALRSPELLGKSPSQGQKHSRTSGWVCTSAGPLYPSRNIGLVFRHSAESGRTVEASPFDSGAWFKEAKGQSEEALARRFQQFREFTLPAPEYREFLGALVASCFENSDAYLRGEAPKFQAMEGLEPKSKLKLGFEVRFKDVLPLDSHLYALVLEERRDDAALFELQPMLSQLESMGVQVYYVESARESVAQVVSRLLISLGASPIA